MTRHMVESRLSEKALVITRTLALKIISFVDEVAYHLILPSLSVCPAKYLG